jgi:hypothetical protein
MKIVYLPNAYEKTIINDFQNGVDMSTFLANGNILLKIFHRFLVFSTDGAFISKVTFAELADKVEPEVKTVAEGKESTGDFETLADIIEARKKWLLNEKQGGA